MAASAYDIDELRYALRSALLAAGVGERVVEAVERIAIECIRRNVEVLPALRRAIATAGIVGVGQVLARFGCLTFTTDDAREAVEIIERLMRGY